MTETLSAIPQVRQLIAKSRH